VTRARRCASLAALLFVLLARGGPSRAGALPRPGAGAARVPVHGGAAAAVPESTLFAFDSVSVPFWQNLFLTMQTAKKHPSNPVVRREKGRPDEYKAEYYGTVIRHDGKLKMWYTAVDDEGGRAYVERGSIFGWRPAYAESQDGIHWTKPALGLVEYRGDRRNNLVQIDPPELMGGPLAVLYEPEDPDPNRRFKMLMTTRAGAGPSRFWTSVPLFSPDGLRWRAPLRRRMTDYSLDAQDLFLPAEMFEQMGLYRWGGMYHLTGQQGSPRSRTWLRDGQPSGRVMTIYRSPDLIHWSETKSLAFVRWGYRSAPSAEAEEAHMPATVWHRGNVLLGVYGLFHGSPGATVHPLDLGLLVSNDGVAFREAVPDHVLLPQGAAGAFDSGGVIQGQGFENIGDETLFWYGGWDGDVRRADVHTEVGLATLRRDGFGALSPKEPDQPASLLTALLTLDGPGKIWVNADGLSPQAQLRVELVDELERPLGRYSGSESLPLERSGVRLPVSWKSGGAEVRPGRFRIRVRFEGARRSEIRLFALYVGS
jgi:hypothetical protein